MTHPTFDSLHGTLDELRRRRGAYFVVRQLSQFFAVTAILIFGFSLLYNWLQPAPAVSLLLLAVLLAGTSVLGWRLFAILRRRHTTDQRLAHYVEDRFPDLEQRLLTSLEFTEDEIRFGRRGVSQQFIARLWQDAERHLVRQQEEMEAITPVGRSWLGLVSAMAAVMLISVTLLSSESLKDSLSRMLWPFESAELVIAGALPPNIEIFLEPGDVELQRGDGLTVAARVTGAAPEAVTLRLQDDNVNWRDAPMTSDGRGSDSAAFSYYIPSLREDTLYYVTFNQGGARNSRQYRVSVYDLPRVEQIDVAFDYPDYTGMEDLREEDGGDLIAPAGTEVEVSVTFNKAVASARFEFDPAAEGEPMPDLPLTVDGNVARAVFTVSRDGVYRVHATDHSELASLDPLDYYIRAIVDQPPELVLRRPGRDQDVMPLEEVILEIDANDDYGLTQFDLNYSVVGQDEAIVDFLPEERVRSVSGEQLIYLEDLGVEPGDFVSYYLTLADNNGLVGPSEIISDIYFLQVIPTDQEFRRSQGGGGGGGGGQGGDSSALVNIQKDIIAATWKLKNRQNQVSPEEFATDAEIIAESQMEATGRARMSIDRLAERLNFSDDSYDQAVESLSLAIEQMNLAARELDLLQVTSALQPEQAALQHILKAEASINRTDIGMQQGGDGGGGGGARQEREDLRELFEMEMGQLENRYENPNSRGQSAQQQEEANKLEELARRQEGLTRAQRNLARRADQLTEEQKRRELERLMRQQEQLSQEVQQLAQQMSRGQQSAGAQQGQNSPNASGNSQQTESLQQAARQMQEAAESDSPSIAAARSQKALENLRRQQQQLGEQADRSVNQLARNLGQRGRQLLEQQRDLREAMEEASREMGLGQTRQSVRNDEDLEDLIESQQRQQQDLEEIEDMLRAVIARGSNEDQRLLSQAQEANRELRPIQEEMQTSNRILRNGMVNLAADIEQSLEDQIEDLAQSLAALDPERSAVDPLRQAAGNARELREQLEELERRILSYNENGDEPGPGMPTVGEMREQLQQSRQLAQQINRQMQQQAQQGGNAQAQGGARQADRPGGRPGGARQLGGSRNGAGGEIRTDGGNLPWGNARSVTQQITRQDIEDFLSQPDLFSALLQPVIELEGALRAQAELEQINNRLYATFEEEIPDEYRDLVQDYYRVLSEQQGSEDSAR